MFSPCDNAAETKSAKDNCIVVFPPHPLIIQKSLYRCAKQFVLGELLPLFHEHKSVDTVSYGVALISGQDFQPYIYGIIEPGSFCGQYTKAGKSLETVQTKKQKKGGQSAQRFGRIHDEKRNVWIQKIVDALNKSYLDSDGRPIVKGLVLAGPSTLKQELLSYVSECNSGVIPLLGAHSVHLFAVGSVNSQTLQQKALQDIEVQLPFFFAPAQRIILFYFFFILWFFFFWFSRFCVCTSLLLLGHSDEELWRDFLGASQKGGAFYGTENVRKALDACSVFKILLNQQQIDDVEQWDTACTKVAYCCFMMLTL